MFSVISVLTRHVKGNNRCIIPSALRLLARTEVHYVVIYEGFCKGRYRAGGGFFSFDAESRVRLIASQLVFCGKLSSK